MTPVLPAAPRYRRAYDHRLREHVHRTGARLLGHGLHVPRSTISSWKRRGPRSVVSLEAFGHDREQLLGTIEKLEARVRILTAPCGFCSRSSVPPVSASRDSVFPRA